MMRRLCADADDNSVVLLRARRFVGHRRVTKDLSSSSRRSQSQLQSVATSTVVPAEPSYALSSLIRGSLLDRDHQLSNNLRSE